jgi:hypothetical protein
MDFSFVQVTGRFSTVAEGEASKTITRRPLQELRRG